ncbi:ABC transporter [Thalassobacillus devorans]|uniref:ABC transporter n=1 Tax=Thalassobacillus devorans TaxID=279813 RepID=A0ABQ1PDN0_9BACI|nr:ABC transporter ATP-binding protein [Thalassobacillus devorans]NIK29244.1 molybdate transport system ATP-binding protein [Thalassobacillus devorans]GGC95193.1 ABC transporter [Thalassobacillus devorans]
MTDSTLKVAITKKLKHFQLDVDFEVKKGVTGIIGPSGCGKSMTLQCLAGLQKPDSGEIRLDDQVFYQSDVRINVKPKERKIGYVFQNYALFPHMTVEENITYGLKGKSPEEKKQKAFDMIEKVQLAGLEDHYPEQLSGGQQQRVALARTLVTEPELLLLDEPFSALDYHVKHILEQELIRILEEYYTGTVLLVTHNMEEAYRLCDNLILYEQGQIVQSGKKEDVFHRPATVSAARIIGCQNLFPVHSVSEAGDHLACKAGDLTLQILSQPVPEAVDHMGIYAENIHFRKADDHTDNLFDFTIAGRLKGIHRTSVTIHVENTLSLTASVPNEEVDSLSQEDVKVELPPSQLFLLESR